MEEMIDAIIQEISLRRTYLKNGSIKSIYFGGGTPSLLDPSEIEKILTAVYDLHILVNNVEITLEANPDDVSYSTLKKWKNMGINRLSLGVQSFNDEELRSMNRVHSRQESIKAIEMISSDSYWNWSMDLIYGGHNCTDAVWNENLELTFYYQPDHISSYALTVEEKTALHHFIASGRLPILDDGRAKNQYETLMKSAEVHEYDHYEISSFSKPGKVSIHNSIYWKSIPYMGIGPSAHSFNGSSRQWNVRNNAKYIADIMNGTVPYVIEELSEVDMINERIMVSIRTKWGLKMSDIPRPYIEGIVGKTKKMQRMKLVYDDNGVIKLTQEGKNFADYVAAELFVDEK